MPDGLPVCWLALLEALNRFHHPSVADHQGTGELDADHAGGHPDAAGHRDAGIHPDLPVHRQDHLADGAGKLADHAQAFPDAYPHPGTPAAAESGVEVPVAVRCRPDEVQSAERSCGGPASADATEHPAAVDPGLVRQELQRLAPRASELPPEVQLFLRQERQVPAKPAL